MSPVRFHFHAWKPGAHGPCQHMEGQYAQCECGAQAFLPDDDDFAVLFSRDRRHRRNVDPRSIGFKEDPSA